VLCVQDAHRRISGILSANSIGILNAHTLLILGSKARGLAHIGILSASHCKLEDSFWLLLWKAFTIGPMSADRHKKLNSDRSNINQNENRFYQESLKTTGVTRLIRNI
jgi:hypothetical protein